MQVDVKPDIPVVSVRSKNGQYVAEYLPYSSRWMVGAIGGKRFASDDERELVARAVMAAIVPVNANEQAYSSCTDGRRRDALSNGSVVPVREQLVGTDTMAAFVAAEALGERFYDPQTELYASVVVRLNRVIDFLIENGLRPTAHIACGAAGSFTGVIGRATQFIDSADYTARLQAVMPEGTYDSVLHRFIVGGYRSRLDSHVYEGYYDGLVTEIVREKVGGQAVECYLDDGRGVHGHCESVIAYLDHTLTGVALAPNDLADQASLQAFGINAGRLDRLARLFSKAGTERMDYLTALIAMHDFSAAGHGTLAHDMETMIIRSAF